jgi:hypothetical protein
MNLLPQREVTIPGTTVKVVVRAWSLLQVDQAKARRDSDTESDGIEEVWGQVMNAQGQPFWTSAEEMRKSISLGQVAALSSAIRNLTFEGGDDLSAFREADGEAEHADPAPDGEGVREAAVGDSEG